MDFLSIRRRLPPGQSRGNSLFFYFMHRQLQGNFRKRPIGLRIPDLITLQSLWRFPPEGGPLSSQLKNQRKVLGFITPCLFCMA